MKKTVIFTTSFRINGIKQEHSKQYNKMKNSILLVDNHHGIYSYFLAYQVLNDEIKEQVNKVLTKEDISFISQNIDVIYGNDFDMEMLIDIFDSICGIDILIDDKVYNIHEIDGDIWLMDENDLSELETF